MRILIRRIFGSMTDEKIKNSQPTTSKRRIQFSVLFSKTLVTECTELNSSGHASVRAENKYAWTRRIIAGAIQTPIPIPVTLYTPSNSLCISRDDACNSLAPIRLAALRIFLPPFLSLFLKSYRQEYVILSTLTSGIRFVSPYVLQEFFQVQGLNGRIASPNPSFIILPFADSSFSPLSEQRFRDLREVNNFNLLLLNRSLDISSLELSYIYNIHFSINFFRLEKLTRWRQLWMLNGK